MEASETKFADAQSAHRAVLGDLLEAERLEGEGADRLTQATRERLNYNFKLADARDRLTPGLKLQVAVARFVWMMSASNRLADIAFYEPMVSRFTDDQLTVPGSSYGMRLRQPQPGLDQVKGVIDRLRENPNTRRAAVSIYQPVDAVRSSNDIPCAFGIFFHGRGGVLNATVMMRSNNAWSLLPFNIFEFSMLVEVVAVEAGLDVGEITYTAGSMHAYERDVSKIETLLGSQDTKLAAMPRMPPGPLAELTKLAKLEADLRHESAGINIQTVSEWVEKIQSGLHPYWAQLGLLLLSAVASNRDQRTLDVVLRRLEPCYKALAPATATGAPSGAANDAGAGPLFGSQPSAEVLTLPRSELGETFLRLAEQRELQHGPVSATQLLRAQQVVFDRLAARGGGGVLTEEAFEDALRIVAKRDA